MPGGGVLALDGLKGQRVSHGLQVGSLLIQILLCPGPDGGGDGALAGVAVFGDGDGQIAGHVRLTHGGTGDGGAAGAVCGSGDGVVVRGPHGSRGIALRRGEHQILRDSGQISGGGLVRKQRDGHGVQGVFHVGQQGLIRLLGQGGNGEGEGLGVVCGHGAGVAHAVALGGVGIIKGGGQGDNGVLLAILGRGDLMILTGHAAGGDGGPFNDHGLVVGFPCDLQTVAAAGGKEQFAGHGVGRLAVQNALQRHGVHQRLHGLSLGLGVGGDLDAGHGVGLFAPAQRQGKDHVGAGALGGIGDVAVLADEGAGGKGLVKGRLHAGGGLVRDGLGLGQQVGVADHGVIAIAVAGIAGVFHRSQRIGSQGACRGLQPLQQLSLAQSGNGDCKLPGVTEAAAGDGGGHGHGLLRQLLDHGAAVGDDVGIAGGPGDGGQSALTLGGQSQLVAAVIGQRQGSGVCLHGLLLGVLADRTGNGDDADGRNDVGAVGHLGGDEVGAVIGQLQRNAAVRIGDLAAVAAVHGDGGAGQGAGIHVVRAGQRQRKGLAARDFQLRLVKVGVGVGPVGVLIEPEVDVGAVGYLVAEAHGVGVVQIVAHRGGADAPELGDGVAGAGVGVGSVAVIVLLVQGQEGVVDGRGIAGDLNGDIGDGGVVDSRQEFAALGGGDVDGGLLRFGGHSADRQQAEHHRKRQQDGKELSFHGFPP